MTPTVAVIVSTYNGHEHLAIVLEGYLIQSRPADELICSLDFSGKMSWRCSYHRV